jgi:hypothetical protein
MRSARAIAADGSGVAVRSLVNAPITQEIVLIWRAEGRFASVADVACTAVIDAFSGQTSPLFQQWCQQHGPRDLRR